jgi:excisionase family DNA binding protein
MDKDVVLTTKEATKYLKISKPTFLKYIHIGKINAIKAGNGWRVHQSELLRFLRVGEKLMDGVSGSPRDFQKNNDEFL